MRFGSFEIGSKIRELKRFLAMSRCTSLEVGEEVMFSRGSLRLFWRRSRYHREGMVNREEGMVSEN